MAQKFLSDIDFAEDLPRPLPVWRVSPSEIRDSIKPHPPDRGKKRARDRGRLWIGVNETNWPKKRARKHPKLSPMTRYAKPEFGIQPPLYLPLSSSPSWSLKGKGKFKGRSFVILSRVEDREQLYLRNCLFFFLSLVIAWELFPSSWFSFRRFNVSRNFVTKLNSRLNLSKFVLIDKEKGERSYKIVDKNTNRRYQLEKFGSIK